MLSDLAGMRLTESPASSPSPTPFTVHLKPITLDPGFVLGVVGVVATILAAFWAVWVSKRSVRREAEPIYRLTWTTLLELPTKSLYPPVDDPELRITYGGESVKVVRRGYLAYWNAGDDPIDPKTGLEDKPPRLVIPKAVVLAPPKILACSDDHIDFKARVDPLSPNSIELIFPFLKREQGALVEFLFTGDADFHKLEGRNKQAKDARFDGELRLYKRTTYWDRVLNNLIETMPVCNRSCSHSARCWCLG